VGDRAPFLLSWIGDLVVNLCAGHPREPLMLLVEMLKKADDGEWLKHAAVENAVGFVSNVFARVSPLVKKERPLLFAVGSLLQFSVEVDHMVDSDFAAAVKNEENGGQVETAAFCEWWLKVPSPAEYEAEHPVFTGKDFDSPYFAFEFFGFFQRNRPAIYTPKVRRMRTVEDQPPRGRRGRGAQAVREHAGDRRAKAFPKHSELTAGMIYIVCPQVVTIGFPVMFQAESVADALSVLERLPKLPNVDFYDIACKMDRNGMQRVRNILSHHGVRFCLDNAHAKGHTCSCEYFLDESLAVANGVFTQAAEVQHSVSVKFRGHLAYMSPTSYMAHCIFQQSMMKLTASFKIHHPDAKAQNEGIRLNSY